MSSSHNKVFVKGEGNDSPERGLSFPPMTDFSLEPESPVLHNSSRSHLQERLPAIESPLQDDMPHTSAPPNSTQRATLQDQKVAASIPIVYPLTRSALMAVDRINSASEFREYPEGEHRRYTVTSQSDQPRNNFTIATTRRRLFDTTEYRPHIPTEYTPYYRMTLNGNVIGTFKPNGPFGLIPNLFAQNQSNNTSAIVRFEHMNSSDFLCIVVNPPDPGVVLRSSLEQNTNAGAVSNDPPAAHRQGRKHKRNLIGKSTTPTPIKPLSAYTKAAEKPRPGDTIMEEDERCLTCIRFNRSCNGTELILVRGNLRCETCAKKGSGHNGRICYWKDSENNIQTFEQARAFHGGTVNDKNTRAGRAARAGLRLADGKQNNNSVKSEAEPGGFKIYDDSEAGPSISEDGKTPAASSSDESATTTAENQSTLEVAVEAFYKELVGAILTETGMTELDLYDELLTFEAAIELLQDLEEEGRVTPDVASGVRHLLRYEIGRLNTDIHRQRQARRRTMVTTAPENADVIHEAVKDDEDDDNLDDQGRSARDVSAASKTGKPALSVTSQDDYADDFIDSEDEQVSDMDVDDS